MLPLSKKLSCLALLAVLALTGQRSWGFSLLGPINEAYQIPDIGYNLPGDIGAPKNLGEEYRHNTPVMYYSFDANFADYFGSNGIAAVDSAMAILNSVTNVSKLSLQLNEYPLQATRENYLAEALSLVDLKTWALKAMVEQMGLADPDRFNWTLFDRAEIPNFPRPPPCPAGFVYSVVQRNFDPVPSALNQFQSTPYVNGTLYSYYIFDHCTAPNPIAITIEFPVDPLDFTFTAVASQPGTMVGEFHTGLTRDDVGGFRYLLNPQNFNFESSGTNALAEVTNPVPQLLFTSNLTQLAALALTNDAVTLQGLIPNLTIINSSNYFVNILVTNVTPYFTNYPWLPAGSTVLVYSTNLVPFIQTRYVHTFGNVLVLSYSNGRPTLVPLPQIPKANGRAFITIETDTVGTSASPFGPAGSFIITTNTTFTTYQTNALVGDYFVLPTNLCGVDIISSQLTNVTTATNVLGSITNSLVVGNPAGVTNVNTPLVMNFSAITYFTNHAFVVLEANCVASGAALFGGVDRISFVRRDFDSLLGRFFAPITNTYSLNALTNNTIVPEPIQRTVAFPDFLFSADSLPGIVAAGTTYPPGAGIFSRGINFNAAFANQNLAGPGTIEPSTTISFDKAGPIYFNSYQTAFLPGTAQAGQAIEMIIGSFDGSTNAPIVYPNGTSVLNLENAAIIAILPALLADGEVGVAYGTGGPTFTANGGQAPYAWALASGSPGLPPGLYLLPDGTLGGTPTQDGTFDFTIMLTDAGGRTVVRPYSLTIIP